MESISGMKPIAAIIFCDHQPPDQHLLKDLATHPLIEKVISIQTAQQGADSENCIRLTRPYPRGGLAVAESLRLAQPCPYLVLIPCSYGVRLAGSGLERFLECAHRDDAGLYYADYSEEYEQGIRIHRVINYQPGSIRDDFHFGPLLFYRNTIVMNAINRYGPLRESNWGGLYELRLRISRIAALKRIPEPLSHATREYRQACGQGQFRYVDPSQRDYQKEMEAIATEHLKYLGAYLQPGGNLVPSADTVYPVEASVIIPVRNRERTIGDALASALSQKTAFSFNVIVVENHSTDSTRERISAQIAGDRRVVMLIPARHDRGIGGCWNEAIYSPQCGRYLCQLDSDDLYADANALSSMVEMLREGDYGLVVGSYRVVDFSLQELPPGVVAHREWTDENGRNNLLRVSGIGAPRAFPTSLLRRLPFPDVSYGEDYAVALRISREYRVGRIYDPLYLCRRWAGNSDAVLTQEQENTYAAFKDSLRTREIQKRIEMNKGRA